MAAVVSRVGPIPRRARCDVVQCTWTALDNATSKGADRLVQQTCRMSTARRMLALTAVRQLHTYVYGSLPTVTVKLPAYAAGNPDITTLGCAVLRTSSMSHRACHMTLLRSCSHVTALVMST